MFDIEPGDVIVLKELGIPVELNPFDRLVQRAVTAVSHDTEVVLKLAPVDAVEWPLGDYVLKGNVVSDEFTHFQITRVTKNVFAPLTEAVA